MSKNLNNQWALRKRVHPFLENKTFIFNHFRMENIPISTMYNIVQRKENNLGPERKVGSGRTAKTMPKKQIKHRGKSIEKKDGVSQRSLAKRFNVSQQYISKIITENMSTRYRKKTKAQKRTSAQKAPVRPKC